ALSGDWEQALEVNDAFLQRFPNDPEALNRKGHALLELGRLQEAWDAYAEALAADPANMIARRNLQRLEMLVNTDVSQRAGAERIASPRAHVFIEEVGKTWVDELTHAAENAVLATVSPGKQLAFEVQNGRVMVSSRTGQVLGELEQRIAHRLADLIDAGNQYEIYALGMSGHSLRIIIRETHLDPSMEGQQGLPRQSRQTMDLMRERELLSQREEGDFSFGDEDEEELGEDEAEVDEEDEEVEVDEEAAQYVDSSLADDSEEDAM
ncbi:MAG TPA: tetratricopeptide repeat protein, partial [Thermomicrobiales bacterium]|nr:tetratricopeptide repeat protein [Thermomicrobiales bacterium]